MPKGAILVMTFDNNTIFTKDGSEFVKDLSGRGSLGEIHGARVVPGKVGNAIKFDGHGSVNVSGEYPSGASPRTIAAWVRSDEEQRDSLQVVVTYGESPQGRAFGIALWPKMGWGIHGHRADLPTRLDADTQWHHHAITYDGVEGAYYIDGQEVKRGPLQYRDAQPPHRAIPTRPLDTASSPMVFGSNLPDDPQHASFFTGTLDEVVVYDRVLATEEIKTLYQMGLNGKALSEATASAPQVTVESSPAVAMPKATVAMPSKQPAPVATTDRATEVALPAPSHTPTQERPATEATPPQAKTTVDCHARIHGEDDLDY